MAEFAGQPRGEGRRIVVVASRFNETVTMPLAEGAVEALVRHGGFVFQQWAEHLDQPPGAPASRDHDLTTFL